MYICLEGVDRKQITLLRKILAYFPSLLCIRAILYTCTSITIVNIFLILNFIYFFIISLKHYLNLIIISTRFLNRVMHKYLEYLFCKVLFKYIYAINKIFLLQNCLLDSNIVLLRVHRPCRTTRRAMPTVDAQCTRWSCLDEITIAAARPGDESIPHPDL